MALCLEDTRVDDIGRPCVAIEWRTADSDGMGLAPCGFMWACEYTSDWSDGDTYKLVLPQAGETLRELGTPTEPLGLCEGDCDSDADCAEGLRCFFRDNSEFEATTPPGCAKGGSGDVSTSDYCVQAMTESGQADGELGLCEGGCNSDDDCVDGLRCFQRDGNEAVPGCVSGGVGDIEDHSYCVPGLVSGTDTELGQCEGFCNSDNDCAEGLLCYATTDFNPPGCATGTMTALVDKGNDHSSPLQHCEGDCDSDSDCADGHYCYFRESSSDVPLGCAAGGDGDVGTHDYCVMQDPSYCIAETAVPVKFTWLSEHAGLLGWTVHGDTHPTYEFYDSGDTGPCMGPKWGDRDDSHDPMVFASPSFCGVARVEFSVQGGSSSTSDPDASGYLGVALVDVETDNVVEHYERPSFSHTNWDTHDWEVDGGCYRLELRDDDTGGRSALWIQDVVFEFAA